MHKHTHTHTHTPTHTRTHIHTNTHFVSQWVWKLLFRHSAHIRCLPQSAFWYLASCVVLSSLIFVSLYLVCSLTLFSVFLSFSLLNYLRVLIVPNNLCAGVYTGDWFHCGWWPWYCCLYICIHACVSILYPSTAEKVCVFVCVCVCVCTCLYNIYNKWLCCWITLVLRLGLSLYCFRLL